MCQQTYFFVFLGFTNTLRHLISRTIGSSLKTGKRKLSYALRIHWIDCFLKKENTKKRAAQSECFANEWWCIFQKTGLILKNELVFATSFKFLSSFDGARFENLDESVAQLWDEPVDRSPFFSKLHNHSFAKHLGCTFISDELKNCPFSWNPKLMLLEISCHISKSVNNIIWNIFRLHKLVCGNYFQEVLVHWVEGFKKMDNCWARRI